MKSILEREGLEALARFARTNALVAFDYDGTLAPIVANPDQAHPRPGTRALLADVTRLYPTAVISGRKRQDALARLGDVQLWGASGNHGAEVLGVTEAYEEKVRAWRPLFEERLAGHAGLVIEDKGFSLTVHYRNAADPRAAVAAIQEVAAQLRGARILGGKKVVNVVPDDAPHKGVALDCMRRWSGCDVAIYVGDDVTDEDAFALDPAQVLSIRVGLSDRSRAAWGLEDQLAVDRLLAALVELKAPRAAIG